MPSGVAPEAAVADSAPTAGGGVGFGVGVGVGVGVGGESVDGTAGAISAAKAGRLTERRRPRSDPAAKPSRANAARRDSGGGGIMIGES